MSDPFPVSNSLIDSLIKFSKELGVLSLVLGFYMLQSAGIIDNPVEENLAAIEKELQEIKGQNILHDAAMKELTKAVEAQGDQLEEEAKKRQLKCVLRATTPEERRACLTSKE